MVEKDIKRKAKIEGNRIIVVSQVNEVMDEHEFKSTYSYRYGELQQLKNQLEALRSELRKYDDAEETEEIRKLAEQLKLAERLKRKDELINSIKEMEKRVAESENDIQSFSSIINKLKSR